MGISVTPIPKLTAFATPDLTLTTANAAGTAGTKTTIRSDASILVYDATVPTTIAYGASAAAGSAAVSARRDHTHGMAASDAVAQASEAEVEGESDVDKYVAPDFVKFSPGVAKQWCSLLTGGISSLTYNTTSVGQDSTGVYTVTIATDMSTSSYTVSVSMRDPVAHSSTTSNWVEGAYKVRTYNNSGAAVGADTAVAVYGTQ